MTRAIRIEGVGKKYRKGEIHYLNNNLREFLAKVTKSTFSRLNPFRFEKNKTDRNLLNRPDASEFWALRDINLEVMRGEVFGIIGQNGAGKSTLLKILSRITLPTCGSIWYSGRMASLLEVGMGFHRELTGRENIYLNGTILGMRRYEINQKFDEIVEFAGVSEFIDTPVKFYSSGMHVRLGFAVAAYLNTDILIVDEVLAVGDTDFRKKCMFKMEEIALEERTVLLVSHNIGIISTLTDRAMLLENGTAVFVGPTKEAVRRYLSAGCNDSVEWCAKVHSQNPIQILKAEVTAGDGIHSTQLDVLKDIHISLEYEVRRPVKGAVIAVNLHASDGAMILSTEDSDIMTHLLQKRESGMFHVSVVIPGGWLAKGDYLVRLCCGVPGKSVFDDIEALRFTFVETGDPLTRGHKTGSYLLPTLPWKMEQMSIT